MYKEAMPVFLNGGKTAVLLIHGYLGSPYDVEYLADRLNSKGFTVSVPRLPGHGTNADDFLLSGGKDWLRKVYDSYMELDSRYEKVVIAGFSMGALLAVIAAAEFKPEKLILIAPPLTTRRRLLLFASPVIKIFVKSMNKNCRIKTNSEYEEYLKKEYWSKDWTKAASDILFLQLKALRLLSTLESQVLLVLSERDSTIPIKVSEIAGKRIRRLTEKRVFNSDHMIFKGEDKERAAEIIIDWLKKN